MDNTLACEKLDARQLVRLEIAELEETVLGLRGELDDVRKSEVRSICLNHSFNCLTVTVGQALLAAQLETAEVARAEAEVRRMVFSHATFCTKPPNPTPTLGFVEGPG